MFKVKISNKMSDSDERYLTTKEAVDYYPITATKLRELTKYGKLKPHRIGQFNKYKESDIIRISKKEYAEKFRRKSSHYSLRYTNIFNN